MDGVPADLAVLVVVQEAAGAGTVAGLDVETEAVAFLEQIADRQDLNPDLVNFAGREFLFAVVRMIRAIEG